MYELHKLQLLAITKEHEDDSWKALQAECAYLSNWGLQVLQRSLLGYVQSVVLEPHYICKDHRNLFSQFYSKKFISPSSIASRLHFFSSPVVSIEELMYDPEKYSSAYIGYSVVRPVSERCLGRTLIDPFKIGKGSTGNFYCLTTPFKTNLDGARFKVNGFPYTSQDIDVTVCAHSALWIMCRFLSERFVLYKEVYPFDLVKMTGTSLGRTFPYRGMTYSDYSEILSSFGVYPIILRLKQHPTEKKPSQEELKKLYTYVESGMPVLASFAGHVVDLIGHTVDYSRPYTPDSEGFVDSFSFLKQFVVIDDNFSPYALLGYEGDPENYGCVYPGGGYSIDSIATAVCPLPEKAFLPTEKAKEKALKYFRSFKPVLNSFCSGPWVTRFFITTNTAFKRKKLINVRSGDDKLGSFIVSLNLPHFIWVMEISSVDQYTNKKCVAEIVLDSTASEKDNAVIYMRIGNKLFFQDKEKVMSDVPDHFPQFIHNLRKEN